jgi:uncharacterized protein (TIGR02145 family)
MRLPMTDSKRSSFILSPIICILLFISMKCEELTPPEVAFSAERMTVLEGDTIHFTDETTNGPTSWSWSFGDGNTSTKQNPEHVYSAPGNYTVELTAINEDGSNSLEKPDFITIIKTGTFTDDRDGNSYRTVEIGNQVWMAENLKYLPSVNTPPEYSHINPTYYVYDNESTDINTAIIANEYMIYGVLYNWPAAMNGGESSESNPSGVQGVCPAGWHLPSDAEWQDLRDYLGGNEIAGGKLKEEGSFHWGYPNVGASNESGFTALPAGFYIAYTLHDPPYDGDPPEYALVGEQAAYWSTSEITDKSATLYALEDIEKGFYQKKLQNSKQWGISVRCIKDE